jgi:GNAT superfamily N-acetyltransferase
MTVVIERAAESDAIVLGEATAAAVRELVRHCSPGSLRARFSLPGAPDPDRVFTRYRRYLLAGPPSGTTTLATVRGRPVGLLNLGIVADGLVEVGLLAADRWQRRGVATSLLAAELTSPRWAGWTVLADVRADNTPARRLLAAQRWGVCRRVAADGEHLQYEIVVRDADPGR